MYARFTLTFLCIAVISGCGDSSGNHTVLSTNKISFFVALNELQVVQGGSSTGSATANLVLDLDDNSLSGSVILNGVDANNVTLKQGVAGETGTLMMTLQQDSATQWSLPADTLLSEADVIALNSANLYLEATTPASPEGAVRGQIVPDGFEIYFIPLTGEEVVPAVTTTATALAAATINTGAQVITVHINTQQLTDATSASINQAFSGQTGPEIIFLTQDGTDASHWFVIDVNLTSPQHTALRNEELYFTVSTPAWTGGEVRGQFLFSDGMQPTLSSIQDMQFTPNCAGSGCHSGKVPSAGLDLTLGKSFSELVNKSSTQVPGMLLVAPGDSGNSYLIQKLDGTFAVGGIMPKRGAELTANQIQTIRQWIDGGAPNN